MKLKLWRINLSRLSKILIGFLTLILTYSFVRIHNEITSQKAYTEIAAPLEVIPKADCGIVLTGGANRIGESLTLLSQKRIRKLIISGVNQHSTLFEIAPDLYFNFFIDEKDIILEKRSLTTYGNAQQALPFVEALDCKSVFLITSTLHMPRAFRTFASVFPPDIHLIQYATQPSLSERKWYDMAYEVLKFFFYSLWAF